MSVQRPIAEPSVLVVEDEIRMRDLLVRAIGSWGLPASGATTGEEAIRMMEAEPRHIVVLDLNLPAMGGMECFAQIRQRWPRTQVIILTGFGDLEAAKKAIELEVAAFLTKPCHLGELEMAIDRARRRLLEPVEVALPAAEPPEAPTAPLEGNPSKLAEVERQHILATLARNHGNRAATAAELGISLRTLYYRLSEYQQQGIRIDPGTGGRDG